MEIFQHSKNENFYTSWYVPSLLSGMKQGCETVSALHPTCQLPYSCPSWSHPGQLFLLICPVVVKALSSFQIHKQHNMLYFKIIPSPSTKGILEQAHEKKPNKDPNPSLFSLWLPISLHDPMWALDWCLCFNPKSCFAYLFPTSPGSDVWVPKQFKKYHSCLFSLLFSTQSKILLQLPCLEWLGMGNHSKRLGGAAALVLVSQSECVSYTQPSRGTNQWYNGFALLIFTQAAMVYIDKGGNAQFWCVAWNLLQAWRHNQADWVIAL